MKKVAFIPARGGSKGLPRKNIKPFLGEPLIARTIRIAKETGLFDLIIVNTDDSEISKVANQAGAFVINRPPELGTDNAEVDPLINWTIQEYITEIPFLNDCLIALLYSTAPLRTSLDIVETYDNLIKDNADSALTLCKTTDYLWREDNGFFSPTNYVPAKRAARQQESWNQYKENKAVYFFYSKNILSSGCRIYGKVVAHIMPEYRSVDIDTREDFILAENISKTIGE
ncbi:hypothetical protein BZG04_15780 [Salinivibrio kushneri]|uniref:acylneuraminate cytidylyltransferase family protein n=1 Tax=Salinivibrio kushneri TaxID=1908198 RepID=UPI000988CB79|nr:acylneuraminate cytidylyltransferase family protein [Salinivibrio kushneri]OOE32074.1 hypothetical protein BZG04_15780 [Salinivibrio kushneri]